MNEQLKKLAKQAGFEFHHQDGEIYNPRLYYLPITKDIEKFAELIVRECMELTHWQDFDMCVEQRIRLSVAQDIKQHFGVEE